MKNIETIDMANKTELAKILARQKWCDGCAFTSCGTKKCADYIKAWMDKECEPEENSPTDEPQEEAPTKKMTNRDKINNMNNHELAKILNRIGCSFCIFKEESHCGSKCLEGVEQWLNKECEENPPAENVAEPQQEAHTEKTPDKTMINNPPADNVNYPKHYTSGKIEVIDFIEDKKLGFHLGNAVKYISRAGRKNPDKTVEDLQKAVWYLNRQIERLERELGGQN